jgi:hypothetical protein
MSRNVPLTVHLSHINWKLLSSVGDDKKLHQKEPFRIAHFKRYSMLFLVLIFIGL